MIHLQRPKNVFFHWFVSSVNVIIARFRYPNRRVRRRDDVEIKLSHSIRFRRRLIHHTHFSQSKPLWTSSRSDQPYSRDGIRRIKRIVWKQFIVNPYLNYKTVMYPNYISFSNTFRKFYIFAPRPVHLHANIQTNFVRDRLLQAIYFTYGF